MSRRGALDGKLRRTRKQLRVAKESFPARSRRRWRKIILRLTLSEEEQQLEAAKKQLSR